MPPRESLIAHTILQGFDAQYGRFLDITAGAQQRFEQAEWQAVQHAMNVEKATILCIKTLQDSVGDQ